MRTPNPLTAIKRIRHELDRLEEQIHSRARKALAKVKSGVGRRRRGSSRQACSVCGKTGHNSRFHKGRRK